MFSPFCINNACFGGSGGVARGRGGVGDSVYRGWAGLSRDLWVGSEKVFKGRPAG